MAAPALEVKLFGKWSFEDVEVRASLTAPLDNTNGTPHLASAGHAPLRPSFGRRHRQRDGVLGIMKAQSRPALLAHASAPHRRIAMRVAGV